MGNIKIILVHSTSCPKAKRNFDERTFKKSLKILFPQDNIEINNINNKQFMETSCKSEVNLIVFSSAYLNEEARNFDIINSLRRKLLEFYQSSDWFALPGTDVLIASRLGVYYEEKAPCELRKNYFYLKEILEGKYKTVD